MSTRSITDLDAGLDPRATRTPVQLPADIDTVRYTDRRTHEDRTVTGTPDHIVRVLRRHGYAVQLSTPERTSASRANGRLGGRPARYRILDGAPVPYSLTIQIRDGEDWRTPDRLTAAQIAYVSAWLREARPEARITRIDGGYVSYA